MKIDIAITTGGVIAIFGALYLVSTIERKQKVAPYTDEPVSKPSPVVAIKTGEVPIAGESHFVPKSSTPDETPYFQRYNFPPEGSVQPDFVPPKDSKLKFGLEPSVFYWSNNTITAVG